MMTLNDLNSQIKKCEKCQLYKTATQAVPGEGDPEAEIFFVGEAPGFNEDKEGRPFCGAAGHFLDEMLSSINLDRRQVFIGNIIKHRPPNNRDPLLEEIEACTPWLHQQLEIIKPKLIVTIGRHSMHHFLPDIGSISKEHGKAYKRNNQLYLVLYHPAAGLHQESLKKVIEDDFKNINKIRKIIESTTN